MAKGFGVSPITNKITNAIPLIIKFKKLETGKRGMIKKNTICIKAMITGFTNAFPISPKLD